MPYKKYIRKGGKVYGPYIYHSRRVGGKVVSEYYGPHKRNYKNFLWISLGIVIIGLFVLMLSFSNKGLSGRAVLDFKADYREGEVLNGFLRLSLKEGELIPSSTKLILENGGKKYEYLLEEIVSDEIVEGNYYVEATSISGAGSGYGKEGIAEIYPLIYFSLDIYSEEETSEEESLNTTEEQIQEETEETTAEEPQSSGITGNAITSFFRWRGTGNVVLELQTELGGEVSVDDSFEYTLNEGETAEIKAKSVRTDEKELSESVLNLEMTDNELVVTTDYSEKKEGFGEDYLGESSKTFDIDLSDLNLIPEKGELKIKLVYSGNELVSLTTVLQEGSVESQTEEMAEIKEEIQEEGNTLEEFPEEIVVVQENISLTDEEKAILLEEFGTLDVGIVRQVVKDKTLIVGFEYGGSKEEHYYDYSLGEDIIKSQVEKDKIKLLKEQAALLLEKKNNSEEQVSII